MAYQTGTVGPITCNQDNVGNANDAGTPVTYKPDQFGHLLERNFPNVA